MNASDPLVDLKDIHVPQSVSLWPPAYGWWVLALALLLFIGWGAYLAFKRHKRNLAKRQALCELESIDVSTQQWPLKINSLLKRLLQTYLPNLPLQSIYGAQWAELITLALPAKQQALFKKKMLTFQQHLYQTKSLSQDDFVIIQTLARNWIKQAKLQDKNVHKDMGIWLEQHSNLSTGVSHV